MKIIDSTIPYGRPIPTGLHAQLAIQCTCPDTGKTGCFLFCGESPRNPNSRVTPIYDDLADLFTSIRPEWESVRGTSPTGDYLKRPRMKPQLFLGDARGQYIPRDFARCIKRDRIHNVSMEDLDYLARGPGGALDEDQSLAPGETIRGEFYWDVWQTVCDNARIVDVDGTEFFLHQDGDLWLIPSTWQWDEKQEWFAPVQNESEVANG